MQNTYYIVAKTEDYGKNAKPLTIEKHTFNLEEDFETISEYLDDDDIDQDNITPEQFDDACRTYLQEEECMDWEQRLIQCMLLTEEQFKLIQTFNS